MISFGIKDALSSYNYMAFLDKEGVELVEEIALKQEMLASSKTAHQCYKSFVASVYAYGGHAGGGSGSEQVLLESLQSITNKRQRLKNGFLKPSTVVAPQDGMVKNSKRHKDFALEVLEAQEIEASVKLLTKGNVCTDNLNAYMRYLEYFNEGIPF